MKMKTVFFCGDRSRYGAAHLAPVLDTFDVLAIVIPSPARWTAFRERLNPSMYGPPSTGLSGWIPGLKQRVAAAVRAGSRPGVPRPPGVPVEVVDDVNARDFLQTIRGVDDIDLFLSAAYPQIFSGDLLEIPRLGAVNFHPSLLPRCRGAHPHYWAIAKGEDRSGVSAHFMTTELDKGGILAQVEFPIEDLYYSGLYDRIVAETPELVEQVAAFFEDPLSVAREQDECRATYFRNDREIHHRIFWNVQSGDQIRNLVRTERAFCFLGRERVELLRVRLVDDNRNLTNAVAVEPGTIVDIRESEVVTVVTGGCIEITRFRDSGRAISAADWIRSRKPQIGEKFT